jgi:tripeptidyl-peptidase-1
MRFITQAVVSLAAIAAVSDARPAPATHALHEKRLVQSNTWIKRDRVASDALLPIKIGLKQQNLHKGYDYLLDV